MNWIFNLEGTLVDTEAAKREAWRAAGYDFNDEEWLQIQAGRTKTGAQAQRVFEKEYPAALKRLGKMLPLCRVALWNRWPVLTDANWETTKLLVERFKLGQRRLNVLAYDLSIMKRISHLNGRSVYRREPWTYVDVSELARAMIKEMTKLKVMAPDEALVVLMGEGVKR